MPTISEPLTERHAWTFARCRAAFIAGQIGPVTFLVSLQLLGRRNPRPLHETPNRGSDMSIWIAIAVTVVAALYAGLVYVGNKGSFADWNVFAGVIVIAAAWILYGVLR